MKSTDFVNIKPKLVESAEPVQPAEPQILEYPEFSVESVQARFEQLLAETASAGASAAGSVATVVGELGGQSPKELRKKHQGYTNVITRGGAVKAKK